MELNYSENALAIYSRLYFNQDETTPEDVHNRVASAIGNSEKEISEFESMLNEKIFRPNTPCLINAKIKKSKSSDKPYDNNLAACFVLGLDDTMESIIKMWTICARVYAGGGGCGIPLSNLREKGAEISTGGQASGPISYLKVIQSISDSVRSGGKTRRAANLTSFKYNHPDILDYIECKQNNNLSAINISVLVSDEFMKLVSEKKFDQEYDLISPTGKIIRKITIGEVWKKICSQAWKSGDPGLLFYSETNRRHAFPSRGEIIATNPCLPKWAPVLTPTGYKFFSHIKNKTCLYNQKHDCSELIKTNNNARIYEIKLESGLTTFMTLNHKILTQINNETEVDKSLEELKPGDLVAVNYGNVSYLSPYDKNLIDQGITDWKKKDPICITNGLTKDFSYHAGLIIGAVLTDDITYENHKLIFKNPFDEIYLNVFQLYLAELDVYSEIKDNVLNIADKHNFAQILILNDFEKEFKKFKISEKALQASEKIHKLKLHQKIKSIEYHSTGEVYDIQVPIEHHFVTSGIIVHNCGEVTLPDFSMCNLGSLNLVQFLDKNNNFDWNKFKKYICLAVDFLDNVIDKTSYPSKNFEIRMKSERPIGLGIMGLSWLFFKMGIRYGSEKSIELFENICKTLTITAFRHSIERARLLFEKGVKGITIPEKDYNHFIKRLKYFGLNDEDLKNFGKYGIRNSTVTSVAPTGCLDINTSVLTSNGLLKLSEINPYDGNPQENPHSWHKHNITILQDETTAISDQFYINDITNNTRIITKHGYELCGSSDTHRIRVIDIDGNYVWKYLKDVTTEDLIPIKLGGHETLLKDVPYVKLNKLTNTHFNSNPNFTQPTELTEDVAYIIGYFMGDGNSSQYGIRFTISKNESEIEEIISELMDNIFGLNPYIEDRQGCSIYEYTCRDLKRFFEINNWLKIPTGEGQKGNFIPFIPLNIRQSKTSVLCSFLRGVFDADGSIYKQQSSSHIKFCSKFKSFTQEIQTALLTLGIPTSYYKDTSKSGKFKKNPNPIHAFHILSVVYLPIFNEYIGFTVEDKQEMLTSAVYSDFRGTGTQFKHPKLWTNFYNKVNSKNHKHLKYKALKTLQSNLLSAEKICLEQEELFETTTIGWLIKNNLILEPIKKIITETGLTVDISVPEKNIYIANGFVSHNSIALSADTSYAFEPEMALIWSKKLVDSDKILYFTNEIFEKACNDAGVILTDEIKNKISQNKGSCQGIDEIPKEIQNIFVTAFDVGWEKKIQMQEAGQRWITLAISSTCNLPNNATIEDVEEAYLLAWKSKLKGITVYRDGSLSEQPVNFGGTSNETKKVSGEIKVHLQQDCKKIKRPTVRIGKTIEIKTPHGTLYVTGNVDESGNLIEVFLNMGQQGHVTNILLNALGRVISKYLQFGLPLEELCDTLSNSGGYGFFAKLTADGKAQQVESVVDAISKILETHFEQKEEFKDKIVWAHTKDKNLEPIGEKCPQCGEMTLVHSSGCRGGSCPSCGYSACQ